MGGHFTGKMPDFTKGLPFTLDFRKMLEKSIRSRFYPGQYIAELVKLAVENGASYVNITNNAKKCSISFDGEGASRDDLTTLLFDIYSKKSQEEKNMGRLGTALVAALSSKPKEIIVETSHNGDGIEMRIDETLKPVISPKKVKENKIVVEKKKEESLKKVIKKSSLRHMASNVYENLFEGSFIVENKSINELCEYSGLPITLNKKQVSGGFDIHGEYSKEYKDENFKVKFSIPSDKHRSHCHAILTKNELVVGRDDNDNLCVMALVDSPYFEMDISEKSVRKNLQFNDIAKSILEFQKECIKDALYNLDGLSDKAAAYLTQNILRSRVMQNKEYEFVKELKIFSDVDSNKYSIDGLKEIARDDNKKIYYISRGYKPNKNSQYLKDALVMVARSDSEAEFYTHLNINSLEYLITYDKVKEMKILKEKAADAALKTTIGTGIAGACVGVPALVYYEGGHILHFLAGVGHLVAAYSPEIALGALIFGGGTGGGVACYNAGRKYGPQILEGIEKKLNKAIGEDRRRIRKIGEKVGELYDENVGGVGRRVGRFCANSIGKIGRAMAIGGKSLEETVLMPLSDFMSDMLDKSLDVKERVKTAMKTRELTEDEKNYLKEINELIKKPAIGAIPFKSKYSPFNHIMLVRKIKGWDAFNVSGTDNLIKIDVDSSEFKKNVKNYAQDNSSILLDFYEVLKDIFRYCPNIPHESLSTEFLQLMHTVKLDKILEMYNKEDNRFMQRFGSISEGEQKYVVRMVLEKGAEGGSLGRWLIENHKKILEDVSEEKMCKTYVNRLNELCKEKKYDLAVYEFEFLSDSEKIEVCREIKGIRSERNSFTAHIAKYNIGDMERNWGDDDEQINFK